MPQEVFPGITVDHDIQHGRPCFEGTRTPISSVLGTLAGGSSLEEVMRNYLVTEEQIRTALSYAATLLDRPHVYAAN